MKKTCGYQFSKEHSKRINTATFTMMCAEGFDDRVKMNNINEDIKVNLMKFECFLKLN